MGILAPIWVVGTLVIVSIAFWFARNRGVSVLAGVYVGLVVTSIVVATKIITIFGYAVPAGVIVYSASFLITDTISECYGKDEAYTAVWTGFGAMILYLLYALVTVHWPSASFWGNQEEYALIVNQSWRVAGAGALSFIASQTLDIYVFHYLKNMHKERLLGLRNILSTSISQAIDTTLFIVIAFFGVYPILPLILTQWIIKVGIAFIDTPFVYLGRRIITK